jgi:hypothetical protein
LEEAVRAFQGAVIAVSHDRYFLKRIATRVLLVRARVRGAPAGAVCWVCVGRAPIVRPRTQHAAPPPPPGCVWRAARHYVHELVSRTHAYTHTHTHTHTHAHIPHAHAHTRTQAEDCQLKDFGGDYEYYLSKHEAEAVKMEAKFARAAAIEKSQTKAKSKMSKAEKERARKEKGKAFNEAAAGKGMQKRR